MAKCIFSGIHNRSDYVFEFDLGSNKESIRLNCRYNVLTGDAVTDNHFIPQCPPELYDSKSTYDQEYFPMDAPPTFDDLTPLFIGPLPGTPSGATIAPTPIPTLQRFIVLPDGYCRTDRTAPVDISLLKIYAYREYKGKNSQRQQNRLQVSVVGDNPDLRLEIYRDDQLLLSRDVSLYRYGRNDTPVDLYLSISPEEGFFIQPMKDEDLETVQACRDQALFLWEVFTGRREHIAMKLATDAGFKLFSENEETALPDHDYPDAAGGKALEDAGVSWSYGQLRSPGRFPEKNGVPYVAFKIRLISEEKVFAEPGKNKQFQLIMDDLFTVGNPEDGTKKTIEWEVIQPEGARHKINDNGLFTAAKSTGADDALPCKIAVTITVQLEMTWPDAWPKLGQGRYDLGWADDAAGQKAIWLLHNMLTALPETVTSLLKETTFVRRPLENPVAEYIALTDLAVIPDSVVMQDDPVKLAFQFMRMIGRAALAGKCGVNFKDNFSRIAVLWQKYQEAEVAQLQDKTGALMTILQPVPLIPLRLAADTVFSWMIEQLMKSNSFTRDDSSAYADATGWSMNNYSPFLDMPGIGWIAGLLFDRQTPNYPYIAVSSIGNFYEALGFYNHLLHPGMDWRSLGMPNASALTGPDYDFGESFTQYAFAPAIPAYCGVDNNEINDKRKNILVADYFPGDWQPFTKEKIAAFAQIDAGSAAAGKQATVEVSSINNAADTAAHMKLNQRSLDYAADAKQLLLEDVYYDMKYNLRSWKDNYKTLFDSYRKTLHDLEIPLAENPTFMELVRKLAIHGEGLKPYKPKDPVQPGDVLISFEQDKEEPVQPWLVLSVSEDNTITKVAGVQRIGFNGPERALNIAAATVQYIWKPDSKARDWEKETGASAYPQLNKALRELILLWGESENASTGESYSRIEGFFKGWISISGLGDTGYNFEFGYSYTDICNYLYTHGQGLCRYRPGIKLAPGDIVIPYHQNTLGVVTRIDKDGLPLDVLYGGTWGGGALGERPESINHLYGINADELRYYWKPDAMPKRWTKN